MNIGYFTTRMAKNAHAITELVEHVGVEQARWKPAPEKWSIVEVICHLYDEERFDFRTRCRHLVTGVEGEWPRIDPVGWVKDHRYSEQDIVEMRTLFCREREESIGWLNSIENEPDWTVSYKHPQLGDLTAGDMLGAWLAHDYLHMRQIANLHLGYLEQLVRPHSLRYAAPSQSW